jgi:quercetin dioxygenase-like cupin family protein
MKPKFLASGQGTLLTVLGDQQFIKLRKEDTNGAYALVEQVSAPGSGVPLHLHTQEDETFIVLEGSVQIDLENRSFTATAGGTVFLPRNIPHAFKVVGEKPARIQVIISPGGLEGMFQELSELPPGPPDFPKVVAICDHYGVSFVAQKP